MIVSTSIYDTLTTGTIAVFCLGVFFGGAAVFTARWANSTWGGKRSVGATDRKDCDDVDHSFAIESMMANLQHLTSEMKVHVGNHNARIGAITDSIVAGNSDDAELVLCAGRNLVAAIHELQAELAEAKAEIERQRDELQMSLCDARTDVLTGLPNRRAFDQEISRAIASHERKAAVFCLIMMDIDHFKRLNDKHGHLIGDQVLKMFSRCLLKTLRETDFIARFGGEEFAVVLPRTNLADALIAADRVRRTIAECDFTVAQRKLRVTASIGVSEIRDNEIDADLIRRSDSALYAAKKGGRNRCFFHDGGTIVEYAEVCSQSNSASGHPKTDDRTFGRRSTDFVEPRYEIPVATST